MRYRLALIVLATIAATALAWDVAALHVGTRPLLDRHSCLENPSARIVALDGSTRGDALYRFVYGTLFGLGSHAPRAGFPHLDVAPVCTLGWKEPVAALKIGPRVLLVHFAGGHVDSVRFAETS